MRRIVPVVTQVIALGAGFAFGVCPLPVKAQAVPVGAFITSAQDR